MDDKTDDLMELCERAVAVYGAEAQLNMVVEELAELIVAVAHWRRKRVTADAILEEMADVQVMLGQLLAIIGAPPKGLIPAQSGSFDDYLRTKRDRLNAMVTERERPAMAPLAKT